MNQGEVLIKVENVSKKFCKNLKRSLWYGVQDISAGLLGGTDKETLRKGEFWAIRDVSFEVRRGECLGLIGHNGAGKSTLLKMLNGLIRPDEGSIEMHGKVGALIELGAGFNAVLTGKENIFNNGAVLGFTKAEIEEKYDAIITFSELEEFIDMPVQNYSSGMKVRLGFAIAAQMQPDIMLIDEVLAVGDMGFVLKCFNQMDKLLPNTAIILVSHSMPQVARMSSKIFMLEKGQQLFYSNDVASGLTEYYNRFKLEIGDYNGSESVNLSEISLFSEGNQLDLKNDVIVNYGSDLQIDLEIDCKEIVYNPSVYVAFYDKEQRNFAEITNYDDYIQLESIQGILKTSVVVPNINFAQGKYSITIGFTQTKEGARETLFRYQSAIYFTVHGKSHGWAPVQLNPEWKLN
jgi:lipopolysaccharide transport system ATP-binding protein